MLTPYRPQFIEKIIADATGRQFRVVFAVSYLNGEVRGRVVSAQPLDKSIGLALKGEAYSASTPCLPESCDHKISDTAYAPAYAPVASPYFSLEFLINSQPTRAPAFA